MMSFSAFLLKAHFQRAGGRRKRTLGGGNPPKGKVKVEEEEPQGMEGYTQNFIQGQLFYETLPKGQSQRLLTTSLYQASSLY